MNVGGDVSGSKREERSRRGLPSKKDEYLVYFWKPPKVYT